MKATGIVRRIDDLGRIVIPKEIRKTMRMREGDPLEIFIQKEGEVILKKFSGLKELEKIAEKAAESLAQNIGATVCISDRDKILSAAGNGKKEFQGKILTKEMTEFLTTREQMLSSAGTKIFVPIIEGMKGYREEIICPILNEGDIEGSVIFLNKDQKKRFGEMELKIAMVSASFLGKQLEM